MKKTILITLGVSTIAALDVAAKAVPATPFADNMVLQRGTAVPVWGTADAGESVTVSFAGQEKTVTADETGAWSVTLDAMKASKENRTMRITGGRASPRAAVIEIKNVLVGEVWFASGQSNMECPIWGPNPRFRDAKGAVMTSMTRIPFVRFAKNPKQWALKPKRDWRAVWRDFSPESFKAVHNRSLSAVAFYYALELYGALDVPIGIVDSSWGGTNIDAWTPRAGYEGHPELKDVAGYRLTDKWKKSMRKWTISGAHQQPTVLWNGMVASWAPMAMRGFIWYQGCHNNSEAQRYCAKMHALYDGWSREFRNPGLKLYFVQLAPWKVSWFDLQAAQAKFATEEKNAALAVTCDAGNPSDIHPNTKGIVAKRLALHALKRDYGFDDVIADSPTLKNWKVDGDSFVLSFDNATAWYCYNADRSGAKGFEIAGPDGKFFPAVIVNKNTKGTYSGSELIVRADGVTEPRAIRYLYSSPWTGSLYSFDSGLPLGPFEVKTALKGM